MSFFIHTCSHAVVKPSSDFYVNDYANVLSEETENYIIQTNQELNQKTGSQIVVVTIFSLEGMEIEDYATELFREFGIGDKEKNNGLLLLCAVKERKFRVEVGYGLEGRLPDGKTGRIQDEYIIPYLKKDNYDKGIQNGYSAFLQEVAKEYEVSISGKQAEKTKTRDIQSTIFILILIFFYIIFGRGTIFLGGGRGGFHRRWRIFWRRF